MTHDQLSQLPELIDWLLNTIEPIQGQEWQITLNSGGGVVQAKASVVTSKSKSPNQSMTISRVEQVTFMLDRSKQRRKVFRLTE